MVLLSVVMTLAEYREFQRRDDQSGRVELSVKGAGAEWKCVEQFLQSTHSRILSRTQHNFSHPLCIFLAFSRVDESNFESLQQLQSELTDLAPVLEFCSLHQTPVLG